jgi:hypothetical protein
MRHRIRALAVIAGLAFVIGLIVGASSGTDSATKVARDFVAAWEQGDYAAMYATVDARTQRRVGLIGLADAYRTAAETATASRLETAGRARRHGGVVVLPVRVHTRLFGTIAASFRVPVTSQGGGGPRVAWSRALLFPGLRPGESLSRHTALPLRATLLARDGSVLAGGPPPVGGGQRASPLGSFATSVAGSTGPLPASRRAALLAEGVPSDGQVGVSGLELALDDRLRGRPGGELLAGSRTLAAVPSQAAPALRTTISPAVQRAAVTALGGQFGGVVALRPSDGEILAVAGLGIDDVQPPGSTFKMITLAGVLESHLARPTSTFPVQTAAVLDGVRLQNANGESCGGTLANAFAVSCNSVFAPLGAKLGARRLVATAESFGFNRPVGITGAAESTLPPASQISGDLAVGSSAIGQDRVQASALQMALVATTIADGGLRPQPIFTLADRRPRVRAVPAAVAHTVRTLMEGVVTGGTGTKAAITGVKVAGKTGTAELTSTAASCPAGAAPGSPSCQAPASDPRNTDAWFAAFAPSRQHPRIAVGVLLVRDGAGGDTAAPVAREVLLAGLAPGVG